MTDARPVCYKRRKGRLAKWYSTPLFPPQKRRLLCVYIYNWSIFGKEDTSSSWVQKQKQKQKQISYSRTIAFTIYIRKRERERKETWAPWFQVLRRALKMPAGEKSESPKACSSENWIFESWSDSEYLFRVVVGGWGDDRMWARSGNPPSEPKSSSSMRSSSDWKARDEEINREREKRRSNNWDIIVCFILPTPPDL